MRQTTSSAGVIKIRVFEGCKLKAYRDASPKRIWTIGTGHTGAGVGEGLVIDQARADELLAGDLRTAEDAVRLAVHVPLTQSQFDALVSFTFNEGAGRLRGSTLLKLLNAGDYRGAADQFLFWTHAGAEILPDLVSRRAAERALFLSEIA